MLGALKTNLRIYFGLDDNVKFLDEEILKKKKKIQNRERFYKQTWDFLVFVSFINLPFLWDIKTSETVFSLYLEDSRNWDSSSEKSVLCEAIALWKCIHYGQMWAPVPSCPTLQQLNSNKENCGSATTEKPLCWQKEMSHCRLHRLAAWSPLGIQRESTLNYFAD